MIWDGYVVLCYNARMIWLWLVTCMKSGNWREKWSRSELEWVLSWKLPRGRNVQEMQGKVDGWMVRVGKIETETCNV